MIKLLTILLFISIIGKSQIQPTAGILFVSSAVTCSDVDAQKWIDSSGITDAATKVAMCNFVISLKDSSVYDKIHAAWFLAGGDANKSKRNIVNPDNTDGAFRLTFGGTVTFATTGATSNGTTGYADSHFNLSDQLSVTSGALWTYIRTNSNAGSPYDIGASDDAGAIVLPSYVVTRYSDNNAYGGFSDNSYTLSAGSSDSRGFWGVTQSGTTENLVKNGVSIHTNTNIQVALTANNVYVLCLNAGGTPLFFSVKECAFAAITDGLSSTEYRKFYNCVQAFMTALGINV